MKKLLKISSITLSIFLLNACGGGSSNGLDGNISSNKNVPPIAKAKANPVTVIKGDTITFDASDSKDSDGYIVSYKWKDGNKILSKHQSFTISNLAVGSHKIVLIVTDNDGAKDSDSITVTIENATAATKQLKKTGQRKSYDAQGNEVTDGSIKDDGYYQKGVTPSYTRDNTKNIVIDNITGLQWQDDLDVQTVTKPWLTQENYNKCSGLNGQIKDSSKCLDTSGDTAATYCSNLTLGGYSDWRLPTADELMYIVDRVKSNPAINPIFKNVSLDYYWTSTSRVNDELNAWNIHFGNGSDYWDYKSMSHYIRCVRN